MSDKFMKSIDKILSVLSDSPLASEFAARAAAGNPTKDENPLSHFCVYFAGYDPKAKKVFIGHHKKSNLWLFNGGHIDKGETPEEALEREMGEEWGIKIKLEDIGEPKLLTITPIDRPGKQTCTKHYDIGYFVPLTEKSFAPDQSLLDTEFYETGWKTIDEARKLITDEGVLKGIDKFEGIFNKND